MRDQPTKAEGVQIVLTRSIGAQERLWVEAMPQVVFRPRVIQYRGENKLFKICDIRCGRNSQLQNSAPPISAEFFKQDPSMPAPELKFEALQIGQLFRILVENLSNRDAAFEVIVTGDGVW